MWLQWIICDGGAPQLAQALHVLCSPILLLWHILNVYRLPATTSGSSHSVKPKEWPAKWGRSRNAPTAPRRHLWNFKRLLPRKDPDAGPSFGPTHHPLPTFHDPWYRYGWLPPMRWLPYGGLNPFCVCQEDNVCFWWGIKWFIMDCLNFNPYSLTFQERKSQFGTLLMAQLWPLFSFAAGFSFFLTFTAFMVMN